MRYALIFALPLAISFAALGVSYRILDRTGETIGPVEAAGIQQEKDLRYSSALFYRPRPYKIERARLAKADILILGSSRAMQFLSQPWRAKAYNAGGAMRDLESGKIFVDQALKDYRPQRMLIMLDWWWFSETRRPDAPTDASPDTPLTLHELTQPAVWVWNGTLSLGQMADALFAADRLPVGIGVPAHFMDAGWDPFGHYDYGLGLTEQAGGSDIGFEKTLKDIQRTSKRNDRAPSNAFSEESWQRLIALVQGLQDRGTDVILVLPPVAQPIFDWLNEQPEPNLVKELQRRLPTLPALTFDFHDPASIGTDGCEFVDGIHGGEVTYLRVLDAIAADPSADLEQAVDRPLVQRLIAENSGHATVRWPNSDRAPEADFNSLGCKK